MTKKLFIGGLLLAAFLSCVGCESKSEKPDPKQSYAKSQARLAELKKQAAQQPNSRVVQKSVAEADNQATYVEKELSRGHRDYVVSHLNRFERTLDDLNTVLGYKDTSKNLRARLQGDLEVRAKSNPRALFHLQQAKLDLDLFDDCGPDKLFIDLPQNHITFVERFLTNPQAEPVERDMSLIRFRDQMFFEGNVNDHAGDSEQIKDHLRQVSRYLDNHRALAKAQNDYGLVGLVDLELNRVWHLRRGTESEKKLDKRVEVIERLTNVKQKIARHLPGDQNLARLVKEIEERCAKQATNGKAYEEDFNELFYGVDRLEDAFFRATEGKE